MNKDKSREFFYTRCWRLWLPSNASGCISLLFLLFILLPLLNQVFHFVPPYHIFEKRNLAAKPTFDFRQPFSYLQSYEDYYNDHFSFRTRWVRWNNLLTYRLFHVSATPRVVIGKQGWLFLGNAGPFFNEVDYFRNLKPFTARELRFWQVALEERRAWLKRRGIRYLFMVAPNKSTIYPEFMPDSVKKINSRSRLDQLIAHLRKHSKVNVLDLRPALVEAKKIRPAYNQTDTHWNDWGGYVAYCEIIKHLQQDFHFIRPRALQDFQIRQKAFHDGDMALMLTLPDVFWEKQWQLVGKAPLQARVTRVSDQDLRDKMATMSVHVCAAGPLPAALMVHDSFANQMKQFLSEDFSKIVFIWNWALNFFDEIIEKEGIKIVIDEMVEYSLWSRFPANPDHLHRRFE
jgi:alginate O-acetyltransferase complex protein AlgJ